MKFQTIKMVFLWVCITYTASLYCEQLPVRQTVKSRVGAGFFAELTAVISKIRQYEPFNLIEMNVDWSQEFFPYKDDPFENGWNLYFEPIVFDGEDLDKVPVIKPPHFVHDQLCIHHWMAYDEHLPYRQAINRILNKYIKVKQPLIDQFLGLYQEHMEGYYCIGVHVRWSAAHTNESPKGTPKIDDYISEVSEIMRTVQTSLPFKIFLATDSQQVVKQFEAKFSKDMLFYLPMQRSQGREETHLIYDNTDYWLSHPSEFHKRKPGFAGGLAVLFDCLLLSKCDVFIHSSSNIAEFVSFYSPSIESIYLPKNDITWPCRYGL